MAEVRFLNLDLRSLSSIPEELTNLNRVIVSNLYDAPTTVTPTSVGSLAMVIPVIS
jgi:hypothetical protein